MGCNIVRGVINNRDRARQINDFSGLVFGKITPTDIDGLIEYQNKAYIFFEVKHGETELPLGQRIALERLVGDMVRAKKKAIALIAQHDVCDPEVSIDVAGCAVRSYFWYGEWLQPKQEITVKEAVTRFIDNHVIKRVI